LTYFFAYRVFTQAGAAFIVSFWRMQSDRYLVEDFYGASPYYERYSLESAYVFWSFFESSPEREKGGPRYSLQRD
jgi:hypothetical protein